VGRVSHFTEYHWQQSLAGSLRATGCDAQTARNILASIYASYGRTDIGVEMDQFVKWITGDNPPPMVSEVEELHRAYLGSRKEA
jgi:hypothetical protein